MPILELGDPRSFGIRIVALRLPLPPSKNKRRHFIRVKGRLVLAVSDEVKRYRERVAEYVLEQGARDAFLGYERPIRVRCFWVLPSRRFDAINFHDELADAIAPALGINDRHFRFVDEAVFVDANNPGVWLILEAVPDGQP